MKTNLKVVLAAVGIAVVASPALAQSGLLTVSPQNLQRAYGQSEHVASQPGNVVGAYGSAARSHAKVIHGRQGAHDQGAQGRDEGTPFGVDDSVYVRFPQSGG
jgi:hypothetical protein